MKLTGLEMQGRRIDEIAHQVTALGALPQKEGAWDVKTFARFLDLKPRTILNMVRDRRIPCHRIGGSIRFTPADRKRFLAQTAEVPEEEE